jgi:hypothetical protein
VTDTRLRGIQWLAALNLLAAKGRYLIYEGTASQYEVTKRRAKNKVARASRKKNR